MLVSDWYEKNGYILIYLYAELHDRTLYYIMSHIWKLYILWEWLCFGMCKNI